MNIALFDTLHRNTATIRNQLFIVYMHSIKRTELINETCMNRLVYEGHLMVHKCHNSKNDEECNSGDLITFILPIHKPIKFILMFLLHPLDLHELSCDEILFVGGKSKVNIEMYMKYCNQKFC